MGCPRGLAVLPTRPDSFGVGLAGDGCTDTVAPQIRRLNSEGASSDSGAEAPITDFRYADDMYQCLRWRERASVDR